MFKFKTFNMRLIRIEWLWLTPYQLFVQFLILIRLFISFINEMFKIALSTANTLCYKY